MTPVYKAASGLAQRDIAPADGLRVVVITGAPGVGKTSTGRALIRRYAVPAAAMDSDPFVHPWTGDERLHRLIGEQIGARLPLYREWGARVVIITGVILPGRVLAHMPAYLRQPSVETIFYGLQASTEALVARIYDDHAAQDMVAARLDDLRLNAETARVPGVRLVDTTQLSRTEVVDRIAAAESADMGGAWMPSERLMPWNTPVFT